MQGETRLLCSCCCYSSSRILGRYWFCDMNNYNNYDKVYTEVCVWCVCVCVCVCVCMCVYMCVCVCCYSRIEGTVKGCKEEGDCCVVVVAKTAVESWVDTGSVA